MRRVRVIPTLLIDDDARLVKTVRFGARAYIGDPINAVRIFNQKEVDELVLLDIDASKSARPPAFAVIEDIVSEAFMPVAYGGGIRSMDDVATLFRSGIEKVVLSTSALETPELVTQIAERFGNQAVTVCLPVKTTLLGKHRVRIRGSQKDTGCTPESVAAEMIQRGAGEIIVYSIDRDGTYRGYDLALLRSVSRIASAPVVACGGAASLDDFRTAILDGGCAAVAAGSLFVYQGPKKGVLITYPTPEQLRVGLFDALSAEAEKRT